MKLRGAIAGLGRGGAATFGVLLFGLVFFSLVAQLRPLGAMYRIGLNPSPEPSGLTPADEADVPASVAAAARQAAEEIYSSQAAVTECADQLRSLYRATEDVQALLVFSPGGWGTKSLEHSQGWASIARGLDGQLRENGTSWLVLNYQRTPRRWYGKPDELWAQGRNYPHKARDLARRLDFIAAQRPDVTVFLASESNGTIFNDRVMLRLENRGRVYNIVTGPPFYYRVQNLENTLILDDNGEVPDSFSRGDLRTILRSNFMAAFRLDGKNRPLGHVLGHIRAPGHYYGWDRSKVAAEISDFVTRALAH